MLDTLRYWREEHANIERLLKVLESQLSILQGGGRPPYGLMLNVAAYLTYFPRRYHLPREHIAFAHIVQKAPEMLTTTTRFAEEHSVIKATSDKLHALLSKAIDNHVAHRANIAAALAEHVTYYRRHITAEDNEILPLAKELLTDEEWESVNNAAPLGPDPFLQFAPRRHNPTFGAEAEARYRELHKLISSPSSVQSAVSERIVQTKKTLSKDQPERRKAVRSLPSSSAVQKKPSTKDPRYSRLVLKHSTYLACLVLAYLQYYFLDVNLQIERLPSIMVYIFK